MQTLSQSPIDANFVQDPYPFYSRARAAGDLIWWQDYGLACATGHDSVNAILRDRRFGREQPTDLRPAVAPHLAPFYSIESHSMLELDGPRHARLRGLVLRAFTSRSIRALAPHITALCHQLIDCFPSGEFDLLPAYCQPIPVLVIARLLGVPAGMADQLLDWSAAMVGMYQARRTRAMEDAAARASTAFAAYMRDHVAQRRTEPADDLITQLIAAHQAGERLSTDELITTCILLLNAGHEATVHSLGNIAKCLLENGTDIRALAPHAIEATIEEGLRYDPPLHMFNRIAKEDVTVLGHRFRRGDQVACLLACANRDAAVWPDGETFDPARPIRPNTSFGGGAHFCVGAPLARLELSIALPVLFSRCPDLRLGRAPRYANCYHFHGLDALMVHTCAIT